MKMKKDNPNTRKIQAEERRLQILEVALKVFASNGFKGTSIKDIAEAGGISQGLMYHYFSGKEALLEATVEHFSFLPQLRQILKDNREHPAKEVLKNLAEEFLTLLNSRGMLVRIFVQELESNPEVHKAWANLCREGVALLQEYIEIHIASRELRPHNTEVTARCMFSIIFMYHFTRDVFQASRTKKPEFIEETLTTLLNGINQD